MDRDYSMHKLLAETNTNLQELATVDDVGIDWEVSIHQTHPVLELVLDSIEQVREVHMEVSSYIADDRALPRII